MKIRNGFVSNSSSSSFIIGHDSIDSVNDNELFEDLLYNITPNTTKIRKTYKEWVNDIKAINKQSLIEYMSENFKEANHRDLLIFFQTKYFSILENPYSKNDDRNWIKFKLLCLLLAKGKVRDIYRYYDKLYIGEFGNDAFRRDETQTEKDMSYILRNLLADVFNKRSNYCMDYTVDFQNND